MAATEERLKALMLQTLEGDAGAYRSLLAQLAVLARNYYARRIGWDSPDLEDLVQETLMAVHTRRESYSRAEPFTPWIYGMVRYKLIDHFRRSHHRLTEPLEAAADVEEQESFAASTAGGDLERLMGCLPARQRETLRHVKIEGLSVAEAAVRTGQSTASVKVSIHRGLKTLMALVREGFADAD
jgi:RNA polymerase sigma-70 factor (ECF subfamily)